MLSSEWSQLEAINARIDELLERRNVAEKLGKHERAAFLAAELTAAEAERDRLVDRITERVAAPR